MNVVVIDYGMGNLNSVRRAFEECGADVVVAGNPAELERAERIVLPGVGAFGRGMENLRAAGWPDPIRRALDNPRVALIGLCLGMQLLAERGHEDGETPGLGLVKGDVKRLRPGEGERVPHVGWNEISLQYRGGMFRGIPDRTDFYFVHSYHLEGTDPAQVAAMTPYCGNFVSAIEAGNVSGVQFHPEKSSKPGFALLKNFLEAKP